MDSPTFPSGHSEPDPRAGEPAGMAAPDTFRDSVRVPERLRAPPVSVAPLAAPVAPPGPAPGVDYDSLITEDDEPLDMLAEKQQRLLTGPLYDSWAGPGGGRSFLAAANVGVFPEPRNPAIVPDVFLSLDVQANADWWRKEHRSYFVWVFGKAPDLVVEIVSNRKGGEIARKRLSYARMGVRYYVVYDPLHEVMRDDLRIYRLSGGSYVRQVAARFPEIGLGMTLWEGEFEEFRRAWLRWTDAHGALILTGQESAEQARRQAEQEQQRATRERRRAEQERQRAEQERQRAEQERQRADQAQGRAERLEALLRGAGIDPEQ